MRTTLIDSTNTIAATVLTTFARSGAGKAITPATRAAPSARPLHDPSMASTVREGT